MNVLHPMDWDAFGLPAERAAVREGRHPAGITRENVDYRQLRDDLPPASNPVKGLYKPIATAQPESGPAVS